MNCTVRKVVWSRGSFHSQCCDLRVVAASSWEQWRSRGGAIAIVLLIDRQKHPISNKLA